MNQICSLAALCSVSGYQYKGLWHDLSQNLALFGISGSHYGSHIAVFVSHAIIAPLSNLFAHQFIDGLFTALLILELSAAGIGGLYQYENTLLFLFADLYERIDSVGSEIWIHGDKIFIKSIIVLRTNGYFSEVPHSICL